MGSQTRKLRKHTTGLSRAAATRVARNLSRHLEQQPTSNAIHEEMQKRLAVMNESERVQEIASRLSAVEIRRRLQMLATAQFLLYGFAIRGGIAEPEMTQEEAEYFDAVTEAQNDRRIAGE